MNREKLIQHLEQRYSSKQDMLSRIPLGMQPDTLWEELQNRRRAKSIMLPLTSCKGTPYWYVTTPKMIAASEKIVETLYENEADFDPYTSIFPVTTLEEVFYTSFVEGTQITMQAAMDYLTSELPPRDIEEQLITNNRLAGNYASSNLYRSIDASLMKELIYILTDGMDNGGQEFRCDDLADFSSNGTELFVFPSPGNIPSLVDEITAYLLSPQVHPLIKAAVAQAWTILVRPFPEGNERLGRILSNMILIRSGYTFFSEISLSALIARKSYGYFGAIENILREENAGDLTYFIEYFMELLSRAIDERAIRKRQREEENRESEITLAHTPLFQMEPEASFEDSPIKNAPALPSPVKTTGPPKKSHNTETKPFLNETPLVDPDTGTIISPIQLLQKYAEDKENKLGKLSAYLLDLYNEKTYRFSVADASESIHISPHQLIRGLCKLKEDGIVYQDGKRGNLTFYKIAVNETFEREQAKRNLLLAKESGFDPDVICLIQEMCRSETSIQEWRLGKMLALFLPQEHISIDDYRDHGDEAKWVSDMALASQLGLVEKTKTGHYAILKHLKGDSLTLSKKQKAVMSDLYECFGDSIFSTEMVMATLDYSSSNASAYLHRFTRLRILDRRKDNEEKYQFIVTPDKHPELFGIAV